jgi:hypothetical protein
MITAHAQLKTVLKASYLTNFFLKSGDPGFSSASNTSCTLLQGLGTASVNDVPSSLDVSI